MKFIEAFYKYILMGKFVYRKRYNSLEKTISANEFHFINKYGDFFNLTPLDIRATDWEPYEEPQKLHTFSEALEAMKNGKYCVREKYKNSHPILTIDNPSGNFINKCGRGYALVGEDIISDDWIIED